MDTPPLDDELKRISDARHHDPLAVLGRHPDGKQTRVRVFLVALFYAATFCSDSRR